MIWPVIFLSGILTYATRFLPLSKIMPQNLPKFMQEGLQYVSIAVLTPIIINSIFITDNDFVVSVNTPKIYAALAAIAVALISKSIFITLIIGLSVLWIFEFIIKSFILEFLKVSKNFPPKFSKPKESISLSIDTKIIRFFELISKLTNFFLKSLDLSKSDTK